MRLLLGVADFGEHEEKMLCRVAKENSIDITSCERRYTKAGIMQYLDDNPDTDVVVLSEAVEGNAPFTASDYELLAERHENVRVVPILMDERCGTEYVQDVFYCGIYNAVFASDADINMVLRLMNAGRSRKEAKIYYKLRNVDDAGSGANIDRCVRHINDASDEKELKERVSHIHNMLTAEEFHEVLSKLDADRLNAMRKIPEIAAFISEKQVEEMATSPKSGILSSIAGAIANASASSGGRASEPDNIRQPDPIQSEFHMNALSVDDLFEIISNVIVGFVGNQRRSGVTHQAITAAHFLAARGYRVALADCSARGGKSLSAFEAIERYRDTSMLSPDSFSYLGVDYYKNMNVESLNKIFSAAEKYHFVIIDYGTFSPYVKADIGRCSIKCAVCGSMPWEVNQLRAFVDDTRFLSDQMIYLIRGVAEDARDKQDWLSDLVEKFLFADIQPDPFDGSCYPALASLFDKYVKGLAVQEDRVAQVEDRVTSLRPVENTVEKKNATEKPARKVGLFRKREKPDPVQAGERQVTEKIRKEKHMSGCLFVSALKHGVGCSYTSAVIANYLADRTKSICLITDDEDIGEYVSDRVRIYMWNSELDKAFASSEVVVADGGVRDGMSADRRHEMARAAHKYMVCRSGDDYMRALAGLVADDSLESENWVYIFNQIPPSDYSKVRRLMSNYDVCFLPSCDALYSAKEMKSIFSGIL